MVARTAVRALATPAQIKAIFGITKRLGLDFHEVLRERFGLERPEDLSLKQASNLIESLQSANAARINESKGI